MFLTFKDKDLASKKWSMSITEARNPAKTISPTSVFFLIPMTIAQDHMPITQCTALSERARIQSLCWIMENWSILSATRQNIPRPRLERRDSVLQAWSEACVFPVSVAILHRSAHRKSHQERLVLFSFLAPYNSKKRKTLLKITCYRIIFHQSNITVISQIHNHIEKIASPTLL